MVFIGILQDSKYFKQGFAAAACQGFDISAHSYL